MCMFTITCEKNIEHLFQVIWNNEDKLNSTVLDYNCFIMRASMLIW